jgi:hypothetical protein
MTEHSPERSWRARAGDRLLNLMSRKFLLAVLGMGGTIGLAVSGHVDGAIAVGGLLGFAGVQGAADAAITRGVAGRREG